MRFRFTLHHELTAETVPISEPDGWKGGKIILERDKDFFSLIEHYEGSANGAFVFYGDNGEENGGIEFIQYVEQTYGFDANMTLEAEFSIDDINYQQIFEGLLELTGKNEMMDNRMQVPVIPESFWSKFINRKATPVNLSSNEDLDGNPVNPVIPVTIDLPSQTIRKVHYGIETDQGSVVATTLQNEYVQFTPGKFELDEMEHFYSLIPINQTEVPAPSFDVVEEGVYTFDIRWTISVILGATENHVNSMSIYIQFNEETPILFTESDQTSVGVDYTYFTYSAERYLLVGDTVRIYGQRYALDGAGLLQYGFWGTNGLQNGPLDAPTYDQPRPVGMVAIPTYTRITGDTVTPATQAEGYLIHDIIHGVLARYGLGEDPFRSNFLGGISNTAFQYDENGCGWMYGILKGLQIRGYTLTEKPFFISFDQIWNGINPILNLGLGYDTTDDSPDHKIIRIEEKEFFVDDAISVYLSNVRDISSTYDQEYIFKTIKPGYKKWQAEDISGIDDPQTKQTRATRLEKTGKELTIESDFIAAGLAIETTRRTSIKKSADYKYDNDTFIIALNDDDVSPDRYTPEIDENFDSIIGLLHANTRYNSVLTPLRNFFRWAPYFGGCLQSYTNSSYKFVSGEGNYSLATDYSCASGNQCQAIVCDPLSENDDISLASYNSLFGYYFLPMAYTINTSLTWEEYEEIRDNPTKSIGISQTDTGHVPFKIKMLDYDFVNGRATIMAWPKTFFNIQVIDQEIENVCDTEAAPEGFDADYQAILDYAEGEGFVLPSDAQQIIQNQLVIDLKSVGVWSGLDLLYVFATDGDADFAKINWANPGSFDCLEVNSPTHTTNIGYAGNATDSYLNTGWAPNPDANSFSQNDGGVFCYVNNEIQSNTKQAYGALGNGGGAGNGRISLRPRLVTGVHSFSVNGGEIGRGSSVSSIGFFHTRMNGSGDHRIFKNGVQVGTTDASTSTSVSSFDLAILALNSSGVISGFSDHQIGVFGIGLAMDGNEVALYNAWNTYFLSL